MLAFERMTEGDLDEVMEIEREAFTGPWTRGMYLGEIGKGESCYLTARSDGLLAGYGGVLLVSDAAHVMTLAVQETLRSRGLGTRIMLELIGRVEPMGARFFTLEVRKSNLAALRLYAKFAFYIEGERIKYYLDNKEDALIMWSGDITAPEYRRLLRGLWERYGDVS